MRRSGRPGRAARQRNICRCRRWRASDGWILVPADSEGYAAGTRGAGEAVAVSERAQSRTTPRRPAGARARGRAAGAVPRRGIGGGGAGALREASRSARRCRPRRVTLADALGRVLAHDVVARGRCAAVRPLQRRRLCAARRRHRRRQRWPARKCLRLNAEVIACGHAPKLEVAPGTATTIATGGVIPRGADAVVMIEHTELIERRRAAHRAAPRRRARAIHLLRRLRHRARRNAAAARHAHRLARDRHAGGLRARARSTWCGGRKSRCSRPATSWSRPASRCKPAGVYDSNGAIIAAAVTEAGGEPVRHRRISRRRGGAGKGRARGARPRRHGRAVGRHLEGRRRSVASRRLAARPARHPGARRRAQARQAALPRRRRRQADRGAAGLSDLGDLHLPRFRRAGDPRPRRPAAGSGANADRDACRCASPPSSAARNSCWCRWSPATTARWRFRPARAPAR